MDKLIVSLIVIAIVIWAMILGGYIFEDSLDCPDCPDLTQRFLLELKLKDSRLRLDQCVYYCEEYKYPIMKKRPTTYQDCLSLCLDGINYFNNQGGATEE